MSDTRLLAATHAVPIPISEGLASPDALAPGQEAPLRACAIALEADGQRLCIVVSDTLIIPADVLEAAASEITARTGVAFEGLVLVATHTHHAPGTIDILGAHRDVAFCRRLHSALVAAAEGACARLDESAAAKVHFALSQEASFAENSRYLMRDGTIAWYNYPWEDVIRPTGPCDPDLPVLALRRPGGGMTGLIFNHATHNIGTLTEGARSPGLFGLAAQELERRHACTTLFLPGAFGSTHNTSAFGSTENTRAVGTAECVHRVVEAVEEGLRFAEPMPVRPMVLLKRPFTWRMRSFDEDAEAAAVRYWGETYGPNGPEGIQRIFREMREQMAPVQGEERQGWLQVLRLGEIALVCVPAELFARLGMAIRRRSPFRHTFVLGLANGHMGYVGDRDAYDLGGYQLWAGMHSPSAPGTGERMVEQALEMLREAYAAPR